MRRSLVLLCHVFDFLEAYGRLLRARGGVACAGGLLCKARAPFCSLNCSVQSFIITSCEVDAKSIASAIYLVVVRVDGASLAAEGCV